MNDDIKYKVLYTKDAKKKRKVFSDGFLCIRRHASNGTHAVLLLSEEGAELWRTNCEKSIDLYRTGEEVQRGAYLLQIEEVVSSCSGSSCHDLDEKVDMDGDKENDALGRAASSYKLGLSSSNGRVKGPSKFRAPDAVSNSNSGPNCKVMRTSFCAGPRRPLVDATNILAPKVVSFIDDSFWGDGDDEVANDDADHIDPTASSLPCSHNGPAIDYNVAVCSSSSNSSSSSSSSRRALPRIELDPQLTNKMRPHQVEGATFLIGRLTDGPPSAGDHEHEDMLHYTGAILADEMGLGKTLTSIAVLWAFARKEACKSLIVCPCSLLANWAREIKLWLGIKMNPLVVASGQSAEVTINTFTISRISRYPVLILSYEMFRKYAATINKVPNLELMICDEGHRLKNVGGTKTIQALANCKATRRVILSGTPVQNDLQELFAIASFVAPGLLGSLTQFNSRFSNPINRANDANCSASTLECGQNAVAALQSQLQSIMLRRTQEQVLTSLLPIRIDYVVYCGCTREQERQYAAAANDIKRSLGIFDDMLEVDEAEEHDVRVDASSVLPGLLQLRQLCHSSACSPNDGIPSAMRRPGEIDARDPRKCSTKLQILQKMIETLRQHAPREKLVVVSSFTSSLDRIESLVATMGIGGSVLRLDGKVPVTLRQPLVDRFNRPDDDSFLFLLSAKAGGVGINLIGASRLVQYDIDWNPAVDQQAMSRVWREGQRRPVFIYRLITHGKIEDAILQRQYSKSDLASLIEDTTTTTNPSCIGSDTSSGPGDRKNPAQKRMSLTAKDVLQLLYPSQTEQEVKEVTTASGNHHGDGMDALAVDCHSLDVKEEEARRCNRISDPILLQVIEELGNEVIVTVKCVR